MEIVGNIKCKLRLALRKLKDLNAGIIFCKESAVPKLEHKSKMTQPILPSESFAEKQYNLKYVAKLIEKFVIYPGEVFSFWEIVGNPKHLKSSRCIRNNTITKEQGGGICQAAGIIYYLSLISGLKINERHNHSVDIYGDGPRACPIGLDATVSYGYKDLRIYNDTDAILQFRLSVTDNELCAELHSSKKLPVREIFVEKSNDKNTIFVKTYYSDTLELIADNVYKRSSSY